MSKIPLRFNSCCASHPREHDFTSSRQSLPREREAGDIASVSSLPSIRPFRRDCTGCRESTCVSDHWYGKSIHNLQYRWELEVKRKKD